MVYSFFYFFTPLFDYFCFLIFCPFSIIQLLLYFFIDLILMIQLILSLNLLNRILFYALYFNSISHDPLAHYFTAQYLILSVSHLPLLIQLCRCFYVYCYCCFCCCFCYCCILRFCCCRFFSCCCFSLLLLLVILLLIRLQCFLSCCLPFSFLLMLSH